MTGRQMAADHPDPGTGDTSGSPPEQRGVSLGRTPAAAPPAGAAGVAHQPTAAAFPAQPYPQPYPQGAPPQPAYGAPVGPFDPYAAAPPQPFPTQAPPLPGPGYGYPQPVPAPGYPQQPGYGFPLPPPPAAKQRNPVLLYGGVVVGVLVIAIGLGLVVLLGDGKGKGGGGGGGESGSYSVAWAAPKAENSSASSLLGIWGTDKVTVRGDENGIRAYSLADGRPAWSIAPPAGTKEFCAMSPAPNGRGIGAVALNTGDGDCSTLGAVDVTAGTLLWSKKVGADRLYSPTLSVTDKVVAMGGGEEAGGFSTADGTPAWTYKPRDRSCSVTAKAAGSAVVVTDRCYGSGVSPKSQLQILDADSGKTAGQLTLSGENERVEAVLSAEPLVLAMSAGDDGDYVFGFDRAGKPTAKIPAKEAGSDSLEFSDVSDPFTLNTVSGTTLYVQSRDSVRPTVQAFDLTTGSKLWEKDGGGEQGMRLVSGTDKDGAVRAVVAHGYSKPADLVTLGPADGSTTVTGRISRPKTGLLVYSITEFTVADDGSLLAFPRTTSLEPVLRFTKG
ncbi:PQQ-binding-like beta-propeller repeat protein [Kitasatospora sp. NPDC057223]|uniref:outer membrane protein assembly factor BamB family protein n=1 Tax=Kitasatospora sp. NPDC057223 TaxID=3346055 RepID=UPI003639C281